MGSKTRDTSPFVRVQDVSALLPILVERLPKSSHVHNMVLMYPQYTEEMNFFTLDGKLDSTAWIVIIEDRIDSGREVNISAPLEPVITSHVKDAFANSSLIDWTILYQFTEIDRSISMMIFEISTLVKGNITKLTPCNLYYLSREDALALETNPDKSDVEIKSLRSELKTGTTFMYDTCQYKAEGSYTLIENYIKRCPSAGIFKNGQLISGAITCGNGLMGFLYTLEEFRNQNYGRLSMHALMKAQAKQGFIPCSAVEIRNTVSNEFHGKIGMKLSGMVDFMTSRGRK